jgi:diketogulonate reductase-like aldo/keto reductase
MGVISFLFTRFIPFVVVVISVLLGWLNLGGVPEGRFFAAVMPLAKGVWPPIIVGHGKMVGTPPVPDDMRPEPRREDERFLELPGGFQIPQSGLGMCCRPTAYDDVLVERTILWYLLLGGRHIDTAQLYLNHGAIGKGIQEAIRRGVPREEMFITTKLSPGYYGRSSVLEIVPTFLEELGLDYLDLVLMHSPVRFPGIDWYSFSSDCYKEGLNKTECRKQTWEALSELRERGVMRNVGVSNFPVRILKEFESLKNVAPIANNQINFNPWISDGWMETVEYCKEHGITITGYFTLGGSLQNHEAHTVDVLKDLAAKHDKSVAQVMLRWAIQMGTIVIPGTGNPNYMRENFVINDFELSEEDMQAVQGLRTPEEMKRFNAMMEESMLD